MYVKPPSQGRHGVKLPENYSGNAFSQKPQYNDMPPPVRTQSRLNEVQSYNEKPIGDIPPEESEGYTEPRYYTTEPEPPQAITDKAPNTPASSIFSSLLPLGGIGNSFPFGHGIGSEEILILAVMLMVFLSGNDSGESDGELLLLLGLLLFAG